MPPRRPPFWTVRSKWAVPALVSTMCICIGFCSCNSSFWGSGNSSLPPLALAVDLGNDRLYLLSAHASGQP